MALENNSQINYTDKTTIKNWFKTGLKPTQSQFWAQFDSFWHKSESLPISAISNLGNVLDNKADNNHTHTIYATNDASSLSPENVTSWQNALGVDDLNYVEIPTTDATAESHPYVVVIDAEGKSAKRNATDFGKFDTIDGIEADETKDVKLGAVRKTESNEVLPSFDFHQENGAYVSIDSDGVKVSKGGIYSLYKPESIKPVNQVPGAAYQFQEILFPKRTATGVEEKVYTITYVNGVKANENGKADIWGVANNWTHPSQRFSVLVDKSADTTFDRFALFDANGNLATASQIGNALESGLQNTPQAQALRISQLLNGGIGSAGSMSVNLVSPPIVQNQFDSNEYILLRGTNLNLNSLDYGIEILGADKTTVLATIPQNQVQLYSDGIQLIFYYNFYLFTEGTYFIKLTSGSKIYITTLDLRVVQEVIDVDFSNLQWDRIYSDDIIQPTSDFANGVYIVQNVPKIPSNGVLDGLRKVSFKSDEMFAQGEDWYLEYQVNINTATSPGELDRNLSFFGLCYSNSLHNLSLTPLLYFGFTKSIGNQIDGFNNNSSVLSGAFTPLLVNVIMIKQGNLFRCVIGNNNFLTTLSNNSGYSLLVQSPNRRIISGNPVNEVSIIKAYKF